MTAPLRFSTQMSSAQAALMALCAVALMGACSPQADSVGSASSALDARPNAVGATGSTNKPELYRAETGSPITAAFYWDFGGPKLDTGATDRAGGIVAAYDAFLAANYAELGLALPGDRFPLKVERSEPMDGLPQSSPGFSKARLTPLLGGTLEFADGAVTVTFVGNEIISVVGRTWARSNVEPSYRDLIEAKGTDYGTARAEVVRICKELAEPHPNVQFISLERRLRYYRFGCDGEYVDYDAVLKRVAERFSAHSDDWLQFPPATTVRGMTDGGRLPNAGRWIVNLPLNDTNTKVFSGIRVDRREPAQAPCQFRLSVGSVSDGGESVFPFPNLILNGVPWAYRAIGDCNTGAGAFTNDVSTPEAFLAQNSYVQVERMAHLARRDVPTGLFAAVPNIHRATMRMNLYTNDATECAGMAGRYFWPFERICLNAVNAGTGWFTGPHEYAHYVTDMYAMSSPGWFPSCERTSVQEGAADALAISLLHRWHEFSPVSAPFTRAELTSVFQQDPGHSRALTNWTGAGSVLLPYMTYGDCGANPNLRTPYARGMVLSQIMWKIVNAARCETRNSCAAPVELHPVMPDLGRKAFTAAVIFSSHGSVELFALDWRQSLRALFQNALGAPLSATIEDQILQIFDQHTPSASASPPARHPRCPRCVAP
jgi:hypothetical protein